VTLYHQLLPSFNSVLPTISGVEDLEDLQEAVEWECKIDSVPTTIPDFFRHQCKEGHLLMLLYFLGSFKFDFQLELSLIFSFYVIDKKRR